MRFLLILLFLIPAVVFGQSRKDKKKAKYEAYWAMEEKKEAYTQTFKEGDALFAQEKYFEAIQKFQSLFADFPNDQQATARIRDIEIILASAKDESPEQVERTFIPIEKMHLKQEVVVNTTTEATLKGNKLDEQYIAPKVEIDEQPFKETEPKTEKVAVSATNRATQPTKPTNEAKPKADEDFRKSLAKNNEDGFTEEIYTKANRTITKRVIVKEGLGDEYLQVQHQWGGVFYFKNGEPITKFIWEKETEVERP